jgi:hypothetical protein
MAYTRESKIEKKLRKKAGVYTLDGVSRSLALKFTSPERPGVPDRIFVKPIPPEHRAIVAQYFRLREIKSPGKKADPHQAREIAWWRAIGFDVEVVDSEDAKIWD